MFSTIKMSVDLNHFDILTSVVDFLFAISEFFSLALTVETL